MIVLYYYYIESTLPKKRVIFYEVQVEWCGGGGAGGKSVSTMASPSGAGKPPAVLLLRPVDQPFAVALRERYRVLDLLSSGQPLPAERYVRRGLWPVQGDYPLGSKVSGKRVGIIGLGNIGSLIAKRLEAFGCVISYNSRNPKRSLPYTYYADVRALAADSDVLVVSCALNSETRHIVGGEVLDALGEGGVVVNVGRGANVDEAALVRALREGRIAGAGLDVFEGEPKVSPELREMENVVLTPHVAVWTAESRSDLRDHTVANLDAFFSGDPLLTPVMLP